MAIIQVKLRLQVEHFVTDLLETLIKYCIYNILHWDLQYWLWTENMNVFFAHQAPGWQYAPICPL